MKFIDRLTSLLWIACLCIPLLSADDWPTWRHDGQRTGATNQALPAHLSLRWTRVLPPLIPAWPDQQDRMSFDAGYEPIVAGGLLYLGSSHDDSVTAYDTATGAQKWRFQADGPIRFAPVVWNGSLVFACDDGCLYALDASDGTLRWKHRGFPSERKVLGNRRLTSPWPARGGPVAADGKIYFAAGIWPFMGVSIQALDATTGKLLWLNDKQGFTFMNQPHNSPAFAGLAPQGYLAVCGDRLLVPGGRSVPAGFDRNTGEMLYYWLAEFGKVGNASVHATGDCFFNAGLAFALSDGERVEKFDLGKAMPVFESEAVYFTDKDKLCALRVKPAALTEIDKKVLDTRTGDKRIAKKRQMPTTELWSVEAKGQTLHIKAGSRIYLGKPGQVLALDAPGDGAPAPGWTCDIQGTPFSMAAADGRLFVTTLEGHVYCFGGGPAADKAYAAPAPDALPADGWDAKAREILQKSGVHDGYAVCFGLAKGRLIEELARQSNLHVIAIDADEKKVDTVRRYLAAHGLYGSRIAVHAEPTPLELPPYLASLVVTEDLNAAGLKDGKAFATRVFNVLRPYGGVAYLESPEPAKATLATAVKEAQLSGAVLETDGTYSLLKRPGALPGAGAWNQQYADAANSCVSHDALVKAPLGVLWFGGPSHEGILPRHGHGPAEQIVGGRLFIQGPDLMRAVDVYTGRLLWETKLPGVGAFFDNTSHQPGANAMGSNFASTAETVYVIHGPGLKCLDAATGKQCAEFILPPAAGEKGPPEWGNLRVTEQQIIACVRPIAYAFSKGKPGWIESWDRTSSRTLVVLDRKTGKVAWSREAELGFIHNAIAVGKDRIFCIDGLRPEVLKKQKQKPTSPARLLCLDLGNGSVLWKQEADVFGTWLGYSDEHDVLIQSGRRSRDVLPDEPDRRVIAYSGKDGKRLWEEPIETGGPPMLRGQLLITQQSAFDLLNGKQHMRTDPLTGTQTPFRITRNYGCNSMIGSTNLLTFRSAAAAYFDLANDGGTGNLGGFKSSCTSNLIAADGVLNAPDYTRTCVCSYQNQTSLALIHTPEAEMWTFSDIKPGTSEVRALGLNLGAPGDRKAENGTLWLDYPSVGGSSPIVDVSVEPKEPSWFRKHSARLSGETLRWVAASGGEGITSLKIHLARDGKERDYTVRLIFSEPETLKPGERVFDLAIQGQTRLTAFDIVRETGASDRSVEKTFEKVPVKDVLTLSLTAAPGTKRPPLLCGIEMLAK